MNGFGGPTCFVESPDGLWGEFRLPEDRRIEKGDSFSLYDCTFLGVLYHRVQCPPRPEPNASAEEKSAYEEKLIEWGKILKRSDLKMTLALGKPGELPSFVTLLPLEEAILPRPKEV